MKMHEILISLSNPVTEIFEHPLRRLGQIGRGTESKAMDQLEGTNCGKLCRPPNNPFIRHVSSSSTLASATQPTNVAAAAAFFHLIPEIYLAPLQDHLPRSSSWANPHSPIHTTYN